MRKISYARIKKAIPGSMGIITRVAHKAGYGSRNIVKNFINSYPELVEMMNDEEEKIDDIAEDVLATRITQLDESTAKWWLSRRRRQRYGDSMDLTTKGESIQIVKVGIDIDKL